MPAGLQNGDFLLHYFGGDDAGTAEIFDPATQQFVALSAPLGAPRSSHSAALLQNGKVLIVGGLDNNGQALSTAELFDPETMSFYPVSNQLRASRVNADLRVLPDGKVQIVGGDDEGTMEMLNAEGEYFTAYAHLVAGLDSIGKLLRSPARTALLNLNPIRSGLQAALSGASSDASAILAEVTERIGYSLTALQQFPKAVLASGATNSAAATPSAFLIAGAQNAAITTDKTDYIPGETVIISGSGWQPDETVDFLLHVEPLTGPDIALTQQVCRQTSPPVRITHSGGPSGGNRCWAEIGMPMRVSKDTPTRWIA